MRRSAVWWALATTLATSVHAQTPPGPAAALAVSLSADTVDVGDEFQLRVEVAVPGGRTAYFPDSLASTPGVESTRVVEWSVAERADGGVLVSITYPLMAFHFGIVTVPDFAILTAPSGSIGVVSADGGPVGSWAELETRPELAATLEGHIVPPQRLWVRSVLALEDLTEGLQPRPADDVVGASWNWIAALSALVFGGLLLGVVTVSGRDWLAAHRAARVVESVAAVDPLEAAREAALRALDELIGLGLHQGTEGIDEFYDQSSGAVRSYAEHLHPSWGPAHTSTELMRGLERRTNGDAVPELLREMNVAEIVKFGRLRPDAQAAEAHWSTLRSWVAGSGHKRTPDDGARA